MVSGNNRYFALTEAQVADLGLQAGELLRLSPPGSRHLRGLALSDAAWRALARDGKRAYLFRPPDDDPSPAARAYIDVGETLDVHRAYKCRVRAPWWRVPLVRPADLLLTYMNADTPRLCANQARVHHLNSVHGVYLKRSVRATGTRLLPVGALNSLTLLGAEIVGRAYGGGMLKLEPREADRLPVPTAGALASHRSELDAIRPQVAAKLRQGRLLEAVRMVDEVLLVGASGLSRANARVLRETHVELHARRTARGADPRVAG